MEKYRPVCRVEEVPPGSARLAEVDGRTVALFNVDGRFYAMEDTCLHAGGPLHAGTLEDTVVTCPWHGWEYDVTSGKCSMNPLIALDRFQVRVRDGRIEIGSALAE